MQFFTPKGELLEAPVEWEPALIDLAVEVEAWESAVLTVNGAASPTFVAHRFGSVRVLAEWPRSGPGAYQLVVAAGGVVNSRRVTIGSAKLGDDGFAALLDDLERRLPVSIALGLQRAGGLVGLRVRPPNENTLEQEILRLKRAVDGVAGRPGLVQLVPQIAASPHHMLSREEVWVRREQAHRVPIGGLIRTLTRPGNLTAAGIPERVLDSRVRTTVDVYENRLLKVYIEEVTSRLRRLGPLVERAGADLQADVVRMTIELATSVRRAAFLNEVTLPTHVLDRLTMVLMREPRYRAVLEGFLEFRRSVWAEFVDARLESPLQNLPSLYQSWATLQLIDVFLDVAVGEGFRLTSQRIAYRAPGRLFIQVLPNGQPAVEMVHDATGTVLTLTPERTFARRGVPRSISFPQRPDVVVEIVQAGRRSDLLIFDPKYKLDADDEGSGTPVKSDVDKMHSYRDAIRDGDGRHLVRFAGTLYPGETRRYGRGLAAISAMPGADEDLRGEAARVFKRYLRRALDESA